MNNALELLDFSNVRRVPLITQTEVTECGLACLAMVATYHGNKIDIASIRKMQTTNHNGMNLRQMTIIADRLELASRGLKCSLKDVKKLSLPCILHWDLTHFVVLTSVKKNFVYINDPALGKRKITYDQLSKHFTGIALELTPTNTFRKRDQRVRMRLSQLWSKLVGIKTSLLSLFGLSVILQIIALVNPYYMQWVVDEVLISQDTPLLLVLAIGFSLLMLVDVISSIIRSYLILRISNMMSMQMGVNLLRHLLKLPMDFFEKRHIGDIVSRFGSLSTIRERITTGFVETIIDGVMSVAIIIMMLLYSINLTMIVLGSVILYSILRFIFYPSLKRNTEELIRSEAKEQSNFLENVRGIQTIKLNTSAAVRQSLWQNIYSEVINNNIRLGKLNIGFDFFNKIIFGTQNILVIYFAAINVMDGNLTIGMLFAFIAYKGKLIEHVSNFIEQIIQFKILRLHLERISDISLTSIEDNQESSVNIQELKGGLVVENISFRYSENDPWILKNCTLTIRSGEAVAITGESGSGKSTLMKIMLGLLKPNEGRVLVDGVDIRQIGLNQYRKNVSSVMQNDTLLTGSLIENITFFDPEPNIELMNDCAHLSAIAKDIASMPMGYNSLVGDMGNQFSGGQVQRLLLARALYKQPKILFMDEATSHLDTNNEAFISSQIKKLNMTRIIVAHRMETIRQVDRIVRLEKGEIKGA
ncbi:putative microcin-H47 secretion/processing ATP-binding protein MchF [Vibrio owensii]|uniref:Microcin-H47 secretion/processing ATP-binding protein MchF n=1 Tax=Vibrio owensii TaxID=696485 RepID=A0AAU9Q0J5_9VIBR|nr:putative microcin-H47 secretion/processing ATP-binding protein MchF [Vibrio owensii]